MNDKTSFSEIKDTLTLLQHSLIGLIEIKTKDLSNIKENITNLMNIAEQMECEKILMAQLEELKKTKEDLTKQTDSFIDKAEETVKNIF